MLEKKENEETITQEKATANQQATAQIGLRRVQGYIPYSGKAGEPPSGQHRGRHLGAA